MIEERMTVGLVLECRKQKSEWGGWVWSPLRIFAGALEVPPWTPMPGTSSEVRWYYAGNYEIALYSTDTANYYDNLATGNPKLWVVLRADGPEPPVVVALITADPAEGEASTEAGNDTVETIDMPQEVAGVIAEFIALHHVERPIIKRKRDRKPPDVRWRGGPPSGGGGGGGSGGSS